MSVSPLPNPASPRYDAATRGLHWLTAALVLLLFALPQIWHRLPKASARPLEHLHIAVGVLLAAVLVLRIVWRLGWGRRLPPAAQGVSRHAAHAMHMTLYVLLAVQALTGFAKRWVRGRDVDVLGLFQIPPPVHLPETWRPLVGGIHYWTSWLIIALAVLHVAVALVHHYAWRDGLLRRMA